MGPRGQDAEDSTGVSKCKRLLYNEGLIKAKGLKLNDYTDVRGLGDILGHGAQGKVELGEVETLDGGKRFVAIKKVSARKDAGGLADQRRIAGDVLEEFEIQLAVSSLEGVVPLYALFCKPMNGKGNKFYAVMEHLDKGCLQEFMREHADTLPWEVKLRLLLEIARTMQGVNRSSTADGEVYPTIHGDLKSLNILLYQDADERLHAKICDWGSARRAWSGKSNDHLTDATFTAKTRTPRWTPPEALGDYPTYVVKSDVYMFAMIMLETATKELPWEQELGKAAKDGRELIAMLAIYAKAASPSAAHEAVKRLPVLPAGYRDLLVECCHFTPERRPGWPKVVERLEAMLAALRGDKLVQETASLTIPEQPDPISTPRGHESARPSSNGHTRTVQEAHGARLL